MLDSARCCSWCGGGFPDETVADDDDATDGRVVVGAVDDGATVFAAVRMAALNNVDVFFVVAGGTALAVAVVVAPGG